MSLHSDLSLLLFFVTIIGVYGGEFCYDYISSSDLKWCTYGCCGTYLSDCCDANIGLIVGLTVMSIVIVAVIIALVCCCVRRRGIAGQIIHTNHAPGTIVVASNQSTMSGSMQPTPYYTQAYPPGAYGYEQPPPPVAQPYPPAGAMYPPSYNDVTSGQHNMAFKPN